MLQIELESTDHDEEDSPGELRRSTSLAKLKIDPDFFVSYFVVENNEPLSRGEMKLMKS